MIRSNISIRSNNIGFIEFLYPNYTLTKEYSPFIEGGVIFDGDSKYLPMFRDAGIPYIYVKGTPEYDLTIPETLLNFVYEKWDKKPPQRLIDYFNSYDKVNDELIGIAKDIWVRGKYTLEDNIDVRIENLYGLFARGATYDLMKEYLTLSGDMNVERLFYSIQRMLKLANNVNSIKSARTKNNIKAFVESRGVRIEPALMGYLYSPADNVELKMLKLLEVISVINR